LIDPKEDYTMKNISVSTLTVTFLFNFMVIRVGVAQLEPYGLEGQNVTSLSLFPDWYSEWEHAVCAGTDSSGVYVRETSLPGSQWENLGLKGKRITAVHVHHRGVGPMDFDTIIAGVKPDKASGDSTLLYNHTYDFDSSWTPSDIWLDADSIDCIRAIGGYFYSGHMPPRPIFTGNGGAIYRALTILAYWEKVWSLHEDAQINVIHIAKKWPCCLPLWAGGVSEKSEPLLIKSLDTGDTWDNVSPDLGGENTCYSIASHPDYPDVVYAGMKNAIAKTTDGGETWSATYHYGTPIRYFGLAVDPSHPEHVFAGGTMGENSFALYESFDGGDRWAEILPEKVPEVEVAGITSMVADTIDGQCTVYMGTSGSGMFLYRSETVRIDDPERNVTPQYFSLYQNYPNPFNSNTDIRYQIPDVSSPIYTTLRIYNIPGQEIRTLIDEAQGPGYYTVTWDGKNNQGRNVSSGIYLYQLKVGNNMRLERMVMIK
jgi:hypothetical protein